jgi:hypothetical protein
MPWEMLEMVGFCFLIWYRQKRYGSLLEELRNEKRQPWWLYGCWLVFITLFFAHLLYEEKKSDGLSILILIICVGYLLFGLGAFIYQFIKQHAQYSIKDLFTLTLIVAVFCSIYVCFGWHVLYFSMLILLAVITFYVNDIAKHKILVLDHENTKTRKEENSNK